MNGKYHRDYAGESRIWYIWLGLLCIIIGLVLAGNQRTVTPNYFNAAQRWIEGSPLYLGTMKSGFIYLPSAAVLLTPFTLLPFVVAEIIWRIIVIGSFSYAAYIFSGVRAWGGGKFSFLLVTLVSVPLGWDCFRNGQMTLLVGALIMVAACDLQEQRWWRSAAWLCLAVALKQMAMAMVLLTAVLYRPMRGRLLAGLALVLLFPFAAQAPMYVTEQYKACLQMLQHAAELGKVVYFADLFGMLRVAAIEVPGWLKTGISLSGVLCAVALCMRVRKRSPHFLPFYLFAFSTTVLLLFSPRTENNTYVLLAPAIGLLMAREFAAKDQWIWGWGLTGLAIGIVGTYELGRLLTGPEKAVWLAPLMCLFFFPYLIWRAWEQK